MAYFQNITSLAELKRQYRTLALANHPDRGGSTEAMQGINIEFEKLFKIWEHDTSVSSTTTGYENDYCDATAREYTGRVYNEYRFTGTRYKGQRAPEIVELIRKWLKEAYPDYVFSVRRRDYNVISINLMKADFEAFTPGSKYKASTSLNNFHIKENEGLTDRAKEVMENIRNYAMSYNYDDSDAMTDYFNTNFYLYLGIGGDTQPYKVEIPRSRRTRGDAPPQFRHPEGAVHKAIRQALAGACFGKYDHHRHGTIIALGDNHHWDDGSVHFYPLSYSSARTAQKRIVKLAAAGIITRLTGRNGGAIEFRGYTPETEAALERERQEYIDAYNAWKLKQAN